MTTRIRTSLAVAICFVLAGASGHDVTQTGTTYAAETELDETADAQVQIDSVRFGLHGQGTRRVYRRILLRDVGFEVYDAALYLPTDIAGRTHTADAIIYELPNIELRLRFHRDVSLADLRSSARKSLHVLFESPPAYKKHERRLEQFIAQLDPRGFADGDSVALRFRDDGLTIFLNDRRQGAVDGADVQQLVRRMWLDDGLQDRGLCELRDQLLRRQDQMADRGVQPLIHDSVAHTSEAARR
ncbi:MAG: chalcone isomerase family protein [Pirellulales bacterium]